uniref:Uncharacterized protein LOC117366941 isoform X4 n=1 Tax=Geotrypetes seraphini TaxID=260995 RepID=A0A6P8S9J2_GEOSA|nr:uncharacterized protein LOC117366941 isoform X4 [Geotrypetes seraphini]
MDAAQPVSETTRPEKARRSMQGHEPKSSWDNEEEKWKGQGDARENSIPAPKQNSAWIDVDLTNTRISRFFSEDELDRTPRKSTSNMKVETRRLPLEDFKGALNVSADKEPTSQPAALPVKNLRGAAYKPTEPEGSNELYVTQKQLPSLPCPGDKRNKRNSSPAGARGRKWVEGLEMEREEELKEFGCINHGFIMEPIYTEPDPGVQERIEVGLVTDLVSYKDELHMYQFDFGHKHYFQARKETEEAYMVQLADSSEKLIRRGWREVFGLLRIFINVITIFLIELIRFLSKFGFQVLAVGMMTALGDYIVKPFLVALFNSLLQPLLIFLLNLCSSLRNLAYPIIEVLRALSMQLALLLRAFRLVEVQVTLKPPSVQQV